MKVENTQVFGFQAALRGMRNPLDSWDKSDSMICVYDNPLYPASNNANEEYFILGDADKDLSQRLTKAGTEHCKHLRMIQVWVDITLPRYIWTEFDTYQHVNKISCSTMHTLMKQTLTPDMFEDGFNYIAKDQIDAMLAFIDDYSKTTDKAIKKNCKYVVKSLLPESFLQKRTVNTSYMTLLNIYKQRKNHELPQWHTICDWIKNLPYFVELIGIEIK